MIRNAVIDNMLKRRSIRRFRQEQISEEELATILQAGLYVFGRRLLLYRFCVGFV